MPELPDFEPPVAPTPNTRRALQDINSPVHTDGFYTELVNIQDSAYQKFVPIKRGTPYASIPGADSRIIAQYSGNPLYFLKEIADNDSHRQLVSGEYNNYVIWIWATNSLAQDTCNAQVDYMEESLEVPRFIRESTTRRKDYDSSQTIAAYSTLTGLLSVNLTGAGTGYTFATGTVGNAQAQAVCLNGAIVDWVVTIQGSAITAAAALVIVGDGTGASATARIQPAGALLLSQKKVELPEEDPRSHDYVKVLRVYEVLPGAVLTSHERTAAVRSTTVEITKQKGVTGGLPVETGSNVISSEVTALDSLTDVRVTKKVQSLPADEVYSLWGFVSIPKLLFDIENTIFCNDTKVGVVTTTPVSGGGASFLKKHRVTIKYWDSVPNPDLSASAFVVNDVVYQGKFISFSYGNVLNDAISYDEAFFSGSDCTWDEVYDFPATTPSATDFDAGLWIVREFEVEQWCADAPMYRSKLTEYWSGSGNPSI